MSHEAERANQHQDGVRRQTIQARKDYKPRQQFNNKPKAPPKPTHEQLLKVAMEQSKNILLYLDDGEVWEGKITQMDKYTITLKLDEPDEYQVSEWTVFKHALKGFAVTN